MKFTNWMIAGALGLFLLGANPTMSLAQGNGNGHGKGHNKHDQDNDDEQSDHYYKHHEEEAVRGWYFENEDHLSPGLAKKDQLPSGLEKQLVRRGSLPPAPETHPTLPGGLGTPSSSSTTGLHERPNRWTCRSAEPQNKHRRGHLPL